MVWDGIKRRSEDSGSENPEIILARIDERVKNINEKFTVHMVSFEEHRKEDEKNFSGIYKLVWAGGGIFGFVSFLVLVFKH